ncbi:MAG: TonB system transport protein ExbD [gamma proteobacterium symbiont of Ctena orbiculata]|uniref:Biopolymer transport protein ExbD n=1 Tax=Candidatus Thiodiazotropha taylori TaxID=2792791 RepID=A0A944QUJ3_9GAMM|nr:TonB system transport protein ExbD [Candidatus Thiodiazotropha taylori]PUB87670.1 MAG: TonB system transport protein ExbD [gamma proteobacterium symbiont of Ctena orbiculata]MBT2989014.1 TonB system transport protein ExbD [Candidatus Thiodiazotropha taylori]MBT2996339.1 TonB system transport protein ExbD [Candidatus Thiodiazotropha taylori]MBT3000227.1 TonB system transport protein ExbD [Candidatus Thiodiazotropha taylori]
MKRFDQVNVIPFIDIMLVLLAIVLTTATFIYQGKISLDLPEAEHAETLSDLVGVEIAIDAEEQIFFNQAAVDTEALGRELALLTTQTPVVLYVDKSVPFDRFVTVIDLLKANKLEKLSIVARGNR